MKVIFPVCGKTQLDSESFYYPKPLVEIDDRCLIEIGFDAYKKINPAEIVTIVNKIDVEKYNIDAVVKQSLSGFPHSVTISPGDTAGAVCSVMLASDLMKDDDEVLIANYDQYIGFDLMIMLNYFRSKSADFGIACFKSSHPKWSYAKIENDIVIEVAEKKPISRNALVGVYYFKSWKIFKDAAFNCIIRAPSNKSIYYISDVISECILESRLGAAYFVNQTEYYKFSDAQSIQNYHGKLKTHDLEHCIFPRSKMPDIAVNYILWLVGNNSFINTKIFDESAQFIANGSVLHGGPMEFRNKIIEPMEKKYSTFKLVDDSDFFVLILKLDIESVKTYMVHTVLHKSGKVTKVFFNKNEI